MMRAEERGFGRVVDDVVVVVVVAREERRLRAAAAARLPRGRGRGLAAEDALREPLGFERAVGSLEERDALLRARALERAARRRRRRARVGGHRRSAEDETAHLLYTFPRVRAI